MNIRELFNDEKVESLLKEKLTCLESTNDILNRIMDKLDPKVISEVTDTELVIKLDRRKNKDAAIQGIKETVRGVLHDPENIDLLLSIREVGREVVIRKRREKRLG